MKNVFFVAIAIALFSCKQNQEAEVKTAPSQHSDTAVITSTGDLNVTEEFVEVTFKTEEATQVHRAYLNLKGAFVNTDAEDAASVAKDFSQMLTVVPSADTFSALKSNLDQIATSTNVDKQREVFEDVSKSVEVYLSGQLATGSLIKQYCPMAFAGKGAYWLSDSKEIRNPYYGDKMLKCGVVDKEIELFFIKIYCSSLNDIRISFEFATPLLQVVKGVQLKRKETITAGLQYAL